MLNLEKFLQKYFKPDEKIILACSAGPDSMFLLYKILETSYKKNVVACYFNHKTRPECEDEEAFLVELGKKEGFKVEIAECDIKKVKKLYPGKSFEEIAREKRYQFLDAIMHIYKTNHVITAHHLDDKIETFFFNLARGSKLTGLINMTEKSGVILRPLLGVEKDDILKYLDSNKLKYFIDESNLSNDYTRNFLRNEILPNFGKVNKKYKNNILNTINYLADLKDFVDQEVKSFLGLTNDNFFIIEEFNSLSPFLQKEIIRYIYYISNDSSTIGLSESNIAEVLRFINGKNNKTIKEIQGLKMKKDGKIILY